METAHFAFHYPAELESWTLGVATHMEAIDSLVAREVGYAPTRKTDVVVDDPYGSPNGSAWPYLDRAAVNLWATPPSPRMDIGEFRDWGATLISHEFTHIAHLTRPSRNPLMRALWRVAPVDLGPIPLTAPRWVIEGYATYVEGRVTGSGRPHGVWRPAFLREWALEGQLPRYEQLDAWGAYNGGEFAYLAGSAFLEWLAQRQGDSSLVQLWRRMSARQTRTFDEAFIGVYGESARVLYGRFSTDLTEHAVQAQKIIQAASASADTGSIEQRLSWETGDPALSPDGRHVAIVLRSPVARSRVVIWRTAAEPDTGKQRRDSLLLAADPEDVPARQLYPPPKKILAMLRSPGASYESPRFLRDGRLLLWRSTPQGDGSSSPDLYLWNPANGSVRRVTKGAAVLDADPTPDGHAAIATRCHAGWCDIVTVSLISGTVRTLISGAESHSFYRPRIAPNGASAVVSVHDGTRWRLAIVGLGTGTLTYVPVRDTANHYDATWGRDANEIVDVSDQGGVPNVERINLTTLDAQQATNVFGAAVAPDVNRANGTIWFLSLYSRGYDLRSVSPTQSSAVAYLPATLTPAAPVPVESRPALGVNPVTGPRPFGLAPRQFRWIPQPQADADGASVALGLESMDVIGRSELRLTGALGSAASWRGAELSGTWNGKPPAVHVALFSAEQRLTASRSPVPIPATLDQRLTGGLLAVAGTRQFDRWAARYRVGATAMSASANNNRALLFGNGGVGWAQRGDQWSNTETLSGEFTGGRSFDAAFSREQLGGSVGMAGHGLFPVSAAASYGRTSINAPIFEQFALGGGPSPVIDQAIVSQRVSMPVLPAGIAVGSSVFSYRVNVSTQPLSWYFWSGSTARAGDSFTGWHRVFGVDWSQSIGAIPLAGTPAARAQVGVGESLDAPFRRKLRVYLSLILEP